MPLASFTGISSPSNVIRLVGPLNCYYHDAHDLNFLTLRGAPRVRAQDRSAIAHGRTRVRIHEGDSPETHRCSATLGCPVAPPFVVRRIVPKSPTAVPVFASTKETPRSITVVPLL
jgi:hypothetical protein